MPKLNSLQDLTRVREACRRDLQSRLNTGTLIRIGMGTCGIAAGARETLLALQKHLAAHALIAELTPVGCLGMCAKEPLVDIQQAGKSRILYANITPDMVPRLLHDHLVLGKPVKEWVICRIPTG